MSLLVCPVCNILIYTYFQEIEIAINSYCIVFLSIKWTLCCFKKCILIKDDKLFIYSAMIL